MAVKNPNNIYFEKERLKEIAALLKVRSSDCERAFSSDLSKFITEIESLEKAKSFTQGRATKLSVAIHVYYTINDFKLEEALEDFLLVLEAHITSGIAKAFSQSAFKVLKLLQSYPKRTFMDAELYFLDEKGIQTIKEIASFLVDSFEVPSDKRLYGINRLVNVILNDKVSYNYSVFFTPKFQQINKQESVQKYQPAHYEVWKNNLIKDHHEYIDVHKPDELTINRMQIALEAKLLAAKGEHEYMQEHKDELEIRILGYKKAQLRPMLKFTTAKHTNDKYLRSEVPNILWFYCDPYRKNMSVDEFMLSSQNAYGDVYYKRIDN